ncbi:MAG: YdcH family protein [Methylovulum sp.]|uniref:YdcH family protein n=1 Tax=Methylovulum sp. TaxID=1916980 RepID=UPI002617134B|nr:YdcH family protein [Methylovulum sp.]MDD2723774.1 YdcH family protein [Methylovulum sp.]MDD5123631.1 YdcH family protein [Methylovulum sp.]
MLTEKHDLIHEFPEFNDRIHDLKINNAHFAKLLTEHDELNDAIHRAEIEVDVVADDYLETLKKQRLALKDELFQILRS